jgi:L-threonylcarbamoyladenylate synthase
MRKCESYGILFCFIESVNWIPEIAETILFRRMPEDAGLAAQQLFATLRELDQPDIKLIWVETPPEDVVWDGVRDRVTRAAA